MAAIVAQNLLLQEQLAALNQAFVKGTEPSNQATVKRREPMDATDPMSIHGSGGAWPTAPSMGWGSVISFVDDTHKEVADVRCNSTSNGEMNDAGGLLPLHGGGGHHSPEHDKVGEPSIIQPAVDLTAKTFQGVWYGALVNSSMEEDESRQMCGGSDTVPEANAMDTKMTDTKNDQVQVAHSRQPASPV